MKTYTTIIKTILPLFVVIGMAGAVQAQATASASASATITTALTLTKNADIDFGTVSATTSSVVYLDPADRSNSTNVGSSAALGQFTVGAAVTDVIDLTFDAQVTLTDGSQNPNSLYLLTEVAGSTDGTNFTSLGTLGTAQFTTNGSGAYTLRVGGELSQSTSSGNLSSVPTGTYTGTFNASIIYN